MNLEAARECVKVLLVVFGQTDEYEYVRHENGFLAFSLVTVQIGIQHEKVHFVRD